MVLESTMICVDNSDYMRNGDFIPTRLQAQQEAVNLVCHSKTRSNPENNVGLLTLSNNVDVLATLTSDVGRIMSKLHAVSPKGEINFLTGIRIAQLALKHRQGKNHKMRIVAFVGSPINVDEKELLKVAKKLKKEKVNVDIVSFGEEAVNNEALSSFIQILNGKESASNSSSTPGSHLVTVPPGPHLADALISSPVIQGEDGAGPSGLGGAGFEFGVDPNEDPELALALRVSMEEQRQRQDEDGRRPAQGATGTSASEGGANTAMDEGGSEEALLERALAMSMETDETQSDSGATCGSSVVPDFSAMTEEEQIIYAMQMSMQDNNERGVSTGAKSHDDDDDDEVAGEEGAAMEVEGEGEIGGDLMHDREFIESVLETLPGVDTNDPNVRQLLASISSADASSSSTDDQAKKDGKKGKKDLGKK